MFVAVKFHPWNTKSYTYVYDGDDQITPGDTVVVDAGGERKEVVVEAIDLPEPPFECKPILEILKEEAE